MNFPDKCPTCGADTPAGDWKRWPVSPGVNLERELALAHARIARLEEAGDVLQSAVVGVEGMTHWQWLAAAHEADLKWRSAKEAKP